MTREELFALVSQKKMSPQEAMAALARIEAADIGNLRCEVSPKGAVSLYGLGRLPETMYLEQWRRLIAYIPELIKFLDANEADCKRKGQDDYVVPEKWAMRHRARAAKRVTVPAAA